jgi:hypothetical protein
VLVDFLTRVFGIQRQVPAVYRGRPVQRLATGRADFIGVCGHRDISRQRGRGDPGDAIMEAFAHAGYERFDLDERQDLATWKARQTALGLPASDCDGIPGPKTRRLLASAGKPHGLWVPRPGD